MSKKNYAPFRSAEKATPSGFPGVPAEVIAAISGAVAVVCGANARITGIQRSRRTGNRTAWSMAGVSGNTRPF